ncbi:Uncharacterised protein [Raoultella terrigena]|uniref:Uncharacterized protein n=1 Tax=Raoultella terrigena TaxID=577 RepID=A0A4U9DEL2_RAOTE|nr:Uncharacterised protein [Raoultella terrigena]
MSYPFKSSFTALPACKKLQAVGFGANLPDAGKSRPELADCHIERAAIELRYGKAQLIISPPASAQRRAVSGST